MTSQLTKVLLINGAPESGKDTVARIIEQQFPSAAWQEKFATPLKKAAPAIYGLTKEEWDILDAQENKNNPADVLFGKSPRQVQIAISEDFLKPLYDNKVFGRLAVNRIKKQAPPFAKIAVFSDSGFMSESEVIIEEFGAENVQLWRVLRDGADFTGDSRGHLDLAHLGVNRIDINNNSTIDDLQVTVVSLFKAFLEQ